jgi:hypothetical protein
MNRTSLMLVVSLVTLGLCFTSDSSQAKSIKTPVDMWEVSCLVDPGMEWTSDGNLHIRGRLTQATFYDAITFEISGSDSIISNANLKLATGTGNLFGTWSAVYLPLSSSGTFDGSWTAKLTGGVSAIGKAVGQGTGDLRGMKMKLKLESDPNIPVGLLEVLAATPPCDPSNVVGIIHDTGFVHQRHGN